MKEHIKCGYYDESLPEETPSDERFKLSYNNIIENLNKKVKQLYPNDNVVRDARCVGSVPNNKNQKNSSTFVENIQGLTEGYEYGEEAFNESTNTNTFAP